MRFVKTAESIFDIPSGFTRVEYLQSSGTQYIDTGVKYDINKTYQIKNKIVYTDIQAQSQGNGWDAGGQNSISSTGDIPVGSDILARNAIGKVIELTQTINSGSATLSVYNYIVDGISLPEASRSHTSLSQYAGNGGYGIFAMYSTSAYNYFCKAKCYKYKILENNVLVRDFIPCIDPLGRACMYDLVGKKAYYNQGSGEFTVGRQIIPVDYLESTGVEYIDTGYKPVPATTKFEFMFQCDNITDSTFVFGARPDTSAASQYTCATYKPTSRIRQDWAGLSSFFTDITTTDKYLYTAYNNTITLNDTTVTGEITRSTTRLDYNFLLFTVNTGGTADTRMFVGKVYYSKLWDDGVLVRDFIPCKDENNIGFMFDNVSGTVYENAGTGAFVVGQNKYNMKLRLIKDNILPTGYTQVEYLESSGTQYIDTGINKFAFIRNDVIKAGIEPTYVSGTGYFFGFMVGSRGFALRTRSNSWIQSSIWQLSEPSDSNVDTIFKKFDIELSTTDGFILDGIKQADAGAYGGIPILKNVPYFPLYLFAYATATDTTTDVYSITPKDCRFYYVKIYQDNVLVRDFIPALDPSGTPCMYDLVTRTPFYNAGTGTFITGKPILPMVRFVKDIIPREYASVNYIESTGTQYIDTGITGTNENLGIDINWAFSNNDANMCIFSSRSAQTSNSFTLFWLKTASNKIRFDTTGQTYFANEVNTSVSDDIFNFNYKSAEGAIATLTNKTTRQIQTMNKDKLTTFSTNPLYLFASRDSGAVGSSIKMYYCQIYDSNTLIRNFIPVVRRIDKVAGMWDTVTKQFYGNSGTDNFNYG